MCCLLWRRLELWRRLAPAPCPATESGWEVEGARMALGALWLLARAARCISHHLCRAGAHCDTSECLEAAVGCSTGCPSGVVGAVLGAMRSLRSGRAAGAVGLRAVVLLSCLVMGVRRMV